MTSPPPGPQLDLEALAKVQSFAIKKAETAEEQAARLAIEASKQQADLKRADLELTHKLTEQRDDAHHRRQLEGAVGAFLAVVTLFAMSIVAFSQDADNKKAAWTLLTALLGAVFGYLAGRTKGKEPSPPTT
jgi:molecular chaperone GrpE (heat shock protein)